MFLMCRESNQHQTSGEKIEWSCALMKSATNLGSLDKVLSLGRFFPHVFENQQSANAKTKAQISYAVTARLISTIVFVTRILQFLFYINPKSKVSILLLWLYSLDCVRPGRIPRLLVFSCRGSFQSSSSFHEA